MTYFVEHKKGQVCKSEWDVLCLVKLLLQCAVKDLECVSLILALLGIHQSVNRGNNANSLLLNMRAIYWDLIQSESILAYRNAV